MGSYLKYIGGVFHLLLLNPTSADGLHDSWHLQNVRVKRQEGYVYDRPSVSFELPTRSTTAATQAPVIERTQTPAVDRTQSQFMYYAYPAPSGGETVNIGYSSGSGNTAGSIATGGGGGGGSSGGSVGNGGAGGYNYGVQSTGTLAIQTQSTTATPGSSAGGEGGYNYEIQNSGTSAATQTMSTGSSTGGARAYSYGAGTQNSGTSATQTLSTGTVSSGYNSNTPGPTVGITQNPTTASTNAPKYLPPISSGAVTGVSTSVTVNIPTGSGNLSPAPTSPSTGGFQTGLNIATGAPDAGYLPPLISPSPSPSPQPGSTPPNTVSQNPSGYLPPSVSTPGSLPTPSTISTPASTYLPPVF